MADDPKLEKEVKNIEKALRQLLLTLRTYDKERGDKLPFRQNAERILKLMKDDDA